jgi:hypothetical protein
MQTALQEERDKLLAEKASWANKVLPEGATAVTEDATRVWGTERGELVTARDNALAEAKVGDSYQQASSPHETCSRLRRKNIGKPSRKPKNSSAQLYVAISRLS